MFAMCYGRLNRQGVWCLEVIRPYKSGVGHAVVQWVLLGWGGVGWVIVG